MITLTELHSTQQQGYVTNRTSNGADGGGGGDFDSAVLLSRNSWMIPMLALAAVNVCVILVFEIYVVCKASRNTPSRRHLFLGQVHPIWFIRETFK